MAIDFSGPETAALGAPEGDAAALEPLPLTFYAGSLLLLILGAAGALGAAYLVHNDPSELSGPAVIGTLAALALAGGGFGLWRRARSRGSLQLYSGGFAVARGGKIAALRYDELRALAVRTKEKLNNGRHAGWARKLRALGKSGAEIAFEHFAAEGRDNQAGPRMAAILAQAAECAEEKLAAEPLRGKGWQLEREGFRAGGGAPIALGELTEAGLFDGKVALWRGSESAPFFTVAADSDNAQLLQMIASRHKSKLEADPSTLGRILFRKKSSAIASGAVLLLGAALGSSGFAVVAEERTSVVGIGLALGGLAIAFGGVWMFFSRFECCERGLRRRTIFGSRTLRYEEIDSFLFRAVRHYHNGAYTGTSTALSFRPQQGKAIEFSASSRGSDEDLEYLRDAVARMVARRLLDGVKKGGQPAWGGARMTADGLVFHAGKLIGKGPLTTLPWADAGRHTTQDGTLSLYGADGDKALFKISAGEPNFFPGMLVWQTLLGEARERAAG